MIGSFIGRFKHRDTMTRVKDGQQIFEEVRDSGEWGPQNPEPASDSEICRMSPEGYRSWVETGRKPAADEQPVIAGEGKPASSAVGVQDVAANERFSRASDALRGYRGTLTADLSGLSPAEQFAARSSAKWASHDPSGRIADRRRRRSE